eukprot:4890226-Pleurochrysis_carterae.AAC.1
MHAFERMHARANACRAQRKASAHQGSMHWGTAPGCLASASRRFHLMGGTRDSSAMHLDDDGGCRGGGGRRDGCVVGGISGDSGGGGDYECW